MSTVKRWRGDIADWAASLRFSGFTVLIVVSVIAGALILSPNISTFVQQQREISQLRESVRQYRESVERIDEERAQWRDPAFVRAQARDRLSYVLPGETQLGIIADVVMPIESTDKTNADLTRVERNWAKDFVTSVIAAGTAVPDTPTEEDSARSAQ